MVNITFTIRNSGKNPAQNVFFVAKIIGPPKSDVVAEQERACLKNLPDPKGKQIEFILFPGDTITNTEPVSLLTTDLKILRSVNLRHHAILTNVVGCVYYRNASDSNFHQTGFLIDIFKQTANHTFMGPLDIGERAYQPEEIGVSYSLFGNGPAD